MLAGALSSRDLIRKCRSLRSHVLYFLQSSHESYHIHQDTQPKYYHNTNMSSAFLNDLLHIYARVPDVSPRPSAYQDSDLKKGGGVPQGRGVFVQQ